MLGATGGTGRLVVEQALAAGFEITVLVRTPGMLAPAARAARVLTGDVLADPSLLESAMSGQDAVISTLGVGRSFKSGGLISRAAPALVTALQKSKVKRLVFTSAFGVGATRRDTPLIPRIFMATLLRDVYTDKEAGEAAIMTSSLDWTIVYPTGLTDGPKTGRYRSGEHLALSAFPRIPRADVADFLVRQIDDAQFIGKGVLVSQ